MMKRRLFNYHHGNGVDCSVMKNHSIITSALSAVSSHPFGLMMTTHRGGRRSIGSQQTITATQKSKQAFFLKQHSELKSSSLIRRTFSTSKINNSSSNSTTDNTVAIDTRITNNYNDIYDYMKDIISSYLQSTSTNSENGGNSKESFSYEIELENILRKETLQNGLLYFNNIPKKTSEIYLVLFNTILSMRQINNHYHLIDYNKSILNSILRIIDNIGNVDKKYEIYKKSIQTLIKYNGINEAVELLNSKFLKKKKIDFDVDELRDLINLVIENMMKNNLQVDELFKYLNTNHSNQCIGFNEKTRELFILNSKNLNELIVNFKNSKNYKSFLLKSIDFNASEDLINEHILPNLDELNDDAFSLLLKFYDKNENIEMLRKLFSKIKPNFSKSFKSALKYMADDMSSFNLFEICTKLEIEILPYKSSILKDGNNNQLILHYFDNCIKNYLQNIEEYDSLYLNRLVINISTIFGNNLSFIYRHLKQNRSRIHFSNEQECKILNEIIKNINNLDVALEIFGNCNRLNLKIENSTFMVIYDKLVQNATTPKDFEFAQEFFKKYSRNHENTNNHESCKTKIENMISTQNFEDLKSIELPEKEIILLTIENLCKYEKPFIAANIFNFLIQNVDNFTNEKIEFLTKLFNIIFESIIEMETKDLNESKYLKHINRVFSFYQDIKTKLPSIENNTNTQRIYLKSQIVFEQFDQVKKYIENYNDSIVLNTEICNILLLFLLNQNNSKSFKSLIEEMTSFLESFPNNETYDLMAQYYSTINIEKTIEICNNIIRLYPKNVNAYNILIEIYLKEKNLEKIEHFYLQLKQNMVKPNLETFRLIIKSYLQHKNYFTKAVAIFKEIYEVYNLIPTPDIVLNLFNELQSIHLRKNPEMQKSIFNSALNWRNQKKTTPVVQNQNIEQFLTLVTSCFLKGLEMVTLPTDDTYQVNNFINTITSQENDIKKSAEIYYFTTLLVLKGKSQYRIKKLTENSNLPLDNVGTLNGILMTCHRRQHTTALWFFYSMRKANTKRDLLTLFLLTHNCRDFSDYFETNLLFQELISESSLEQERNDTLQYEDSFSIDDLLNKYLELTIMNATDKVIEVTDIMLSRGIPISSNNRYTVIHQARLLSRQDIELKLGLLEIK